ncbi:Guanidinobutyrase [Nymphon striatum]|nr:Guanidinobutyrase [Nymphon striatum]
MPRFGGIATFMRLPGNTPPADLDVAVVGVPFDIGTSNRPGAPLWPARHPIRVGTAAALQHGHPRCALRQLAHRRHRRRCHQRLQPARLRRSHRRPLPPTAHQRPHDRFDGWRPHHRVAHPAGLWPKSTAPLAWCTSMPIPTSTTRCSARRSRTARRSVERLKKTPPVWCRSACAAPATPPTTSTGHETRVSVWCRPRSAGTRSLTPLMEEVRQQVDGGPVYLSFDIDGLDPAFAQGTGTPEIGGLTIHQGMEIIRGCRGLNIVGADLVEVAPIYDTSGATSLTAANLLYEMLCILPGVTYRD